MNTNNNNNNQSANNNNNNSNIDENSLNLSAEIPDFHVIQDMSDLAESASQFEERIGDEEDISRDFQWLDFYTNQTYYRNAEWRSSPMPRTRTNQIGQNLVLHEYSGGVSYNNAQSNTGSNQFGLTNVEISDNIQYGGKWNWIFFIKSTKYHSI